MNIVEQAQQIAHEAHDSIGQKRKYSGEPYWVHTDEVALIVADVSFDENMLAAAHLHDVLEDVFPLKPNYGPALIVDRFGFDVFDLVVELTDVFTKENAPQANRKQRKLWERQRMGRTSHEAKTIKLADLISNTRSIVANDRDFANLYIREKLDLLPYLVGGNPILLEIAKKQAEDSAKELGL